MLVERLEVKTPGKMMIAGEFAVLEPYEKAIVTAVDRFVYAKLEDTSASKISLPDFGLHELLWRWEQEQIHFSTADPRLDFVASAMETVFSYLKEQGIAFEPVHLTVVSELADKSGIKYGLGSSAAVVSAVVEVMLQRFWHEKPEREIVFKLAAIAHVKTQGSGSGADIAASVYGGLLSYASFQSAWLLKAIEKAGSITELVDKDWHYLSIEALPFPDFVQFLVAWTGTAASTKTLVGRMEQMKISNVVGYRTFIQKSAEAVALITKGIQERHAQDLFLGIKKNRQTLQAIGAITNVPIETTKLAVVSDCAEEMQGAGKSSGAGGGDCGIAFIPLEANASDLRNDWQRKSITPLDIQMWGSYSH